MHYRYFFKWMTTSKTRASFLTSYVKNFCVKAAKGDKSTIRVVSMKLQGSNKIYCFNSAIDYIVSMRYIVPIVYIVSMRLYCSNNAIDYIASMRYIISHHRKNSVIEYRHVLSSFSLSLKNGGF